MKKLYFLITLLIFTIGWAQQSGRSSQQEKSTSNSHKAGAFIDVNSNNHPESSWTVEKLIKDVLITGGGSCSNPDISNVKVSPNLPVTNSSRSWGFFHKGTTNFPFEKGIILSTGYARKAGNSFEASTLGDNLNSGGDSDLSQAVNYTNLYDASYIEFDFVPESSTVTFNYLFASEEYTSSYPCTYTDGFALLLKKEGETSYTNLAVLPNNKGPVAVTNIIPSTYSCGPVNEEYFGEQNTNNKVTNFNGRTIPLTAKATVIPGQKYRFKMVLADASDRLYDSAVFLEAGSFNFGVQFQDVLGTTLPSAITMCNLTPQTLVAATDEVGAIFKWFKNNVLIAGATTNTYIATTSGTYRVEVHAPGNNCPGEATVEISEGTFPTVFNANLIGCSTTATGTTATFNLTLAQPNLSSTPGATFLYYYSQANAISGSGSFIQNPSAVNTDSRKIYVRVSNGGCFKIAELNLTVRPKPAKPIITKSANAICAGTPVVLTSSAATGNLWSTGETSQSITVTNGGLYTLTYRDANNCESFQSFVAIPEVADPNIQISGNLTFCEGGSTTLTSSASTGNVWSNSATTQSIIVTTPGIYTVTVNTSQGCSFTKSVTVTQVAQPVIDIETPQQITCTTNQITLNAAASTYESGSTFLWTATNGGNIVSGGNTLNPVVNKAGTYTLKISGPLCTATKSVNVTENKNVTPPVITATSNVLCAGGTVTLTSSYSSGNVWSTGETSQSIQVAAAGTYSLKVKVGTCYSATVSHTVTKAPNPNIQISGNLKFCEGGSTTLTSSAATGNVWSNGATTQSITVTTPGIYTVTVTTSQGCSFTKSVTVTQVAQPMIDIKTPQQITCTTNQITLNAAASTYESGSTFLWTATNGGNIVSGGNTLNPVVNKAGTYTLKISGPVCTATKSVNVTENKNVTPPIITATSNILCVGGTVTLTSSYSSGNVWSTGETSQSIQVAAAGTYSLKVNVGTCSSATVSHTVTKAADPNIQISGNLTFCEGGSTTLTSSASTGNVWSNGATTQSLTVSTPGIYTVTVTTSQGCSFTKSVTVTQVPKPVINIAAPQQITCTTNQITLNAAASTYESGSTFLWTAASGGNIVSGGNTLKPVVNKAGTYTLKISGTVCTATKSVNVTENKIPPPVTISASDTTICAGSTVTLNANGGVSYVWENGLGNSSSVTVSPQETTTYTVTGTGANGCISTFTITINVLPHIESSLQTISGQICNGGILVLDAGSGPNYSYLWSTGETTQKINATQAGNYSVTISNGFCSETFNTTVGQAPIPQIRQIIWENGQLQVIAQSSDSHPLEYSLDGFFWQTSNIFNNVISNQEITVSVRNSFTGCTATVNYFTFKMANVITPNGDGKNDIIDFGALSSYENFKALIYDRNGREVFRSESNRTSWDGKMHQRPLPTSSYWYTVVWNDPLTNETITKTGWILLKNH